MSRREDELALDDVLSRHTHVLPGRERRLYPNRAGARLVHVLDHDDAIRPLGQRVARVEGVGLLAQEKLFGTHGCGARGLRRGEGVPVHRGGVKMRAGNPRVGRARRHAPQGLGRGDFLLTQAERTHFLQKTRERLFARDVFQINFPAALGQ